MNKSKLAIGIMTAVLTAGTLAGCDNTVKYASDGSIICYDAGNNPITIKAGDLLKSDYYKDSSKYQSIFDAIYSIVVQNYFTIDDPVTVHRPTGDVTVHLGKNQVPGLEVEAKRKVESDKTTARQNADNNNTSYKKEFNAILESNGVEDEEELTEKYLEGLKKETFDENFYKYHMDEIKEGDASLTYKLDENDDSEDPKVLWTGYFKDMVPYHVSHILVKIDDGSGTNYSNGTISEKNAKDLFKIVDQLREGSDSFGTIANANADIGDSGSAANYGDLGIMDYSTGYVNEFKLGVYAYENFFSPDKAEAADSVIGLKGDIKTNFQNVVKESFNNEEVPTIDYSIFKELNDVSEDDKDANDKSVLDDSATFFPRNIIYNKYLNRHSAAFVTYKDIDPNDLIVFDKENPDSNKNTDKKSGFMTIKLDGTNDYNVLVVKTVDGYTPVLCARAGSDYQGIHFIVVNRSPFAGGTEKVVNGVSLKDYYTTFYPDQEDYPAVGGKKLDTYVNFSSQETQSTKSRAESLASTLKSYNSEKLNKYIFKKYFEKENLKLADSELNDALNKWIYRGFEKKDEETKDSWEKTWNDYIDTLKKQNSERNKLVSEACRIAYLNGNSKDYINAEDYAKMKTFLENEGVEASKIIELIGDGASSDVTSMTYSQLFKEEGGLCNDGKAHF